MYAVFAIRKSNASVLMWLSRLAILAFCFVFVPRTLAHSIASSPTFVPESFVGLGMAPWCAVIPLFGVIVLTLATAIGGWTSPSAALRTGLIAGWILIFQYAPAITGKEPDGKSALVGLAFTILGMGLLLVRWKFGDPPKTPLHLGERERAEKFAAENGLAFVDIERHPLDPEVVSLLRAETIRRHTVLPIRKAKDILYVAVLDVNDVAAQDAAREDSGLRIVPVTCERGPLLAAIDRFTS